MKDSPLGGLAWRLASAVGGFVYFEHSSTCQMFAHSGSHKPMCNSGVMPTLKGGPTVATATSMSVSDMKVPAIAILGRMAPVTGSPQAHESVSTRAL